jgi:type IV pilus assembly protein PilE
MNHTKGFTLIELMVAVAIIAILSAVAIPSYQEYIIKSNRAAAQAFMLDLENREKQYFLDARAYTSNVSDLTTVPANVSKFYNISIAVLTAPPTFTITAAPIAGARQAGDGNLGLDSAGVKSPAGKW